MLILLRWRTAVLRVTTFWTFCASSRRAACQNILEFLRENSPLFPCGNLRFGEISVEFPLGSRERRM